MARRSILTAGPKRYDEDSAEISTHEVVEPVVASSPRLPRSPGAAMLGDFDERIAASYFRESEGGDRRFRDLRIDSRAA
jgi:hypothetical protein